MKILVAASIAITGALAGCAITPEQIECLQPNWRVAVEINGTRPGLPPKPKPEAKPEAGAKPEAKPEAAAKPEAKPKPVLVPTEYTELVQGNSAFDFKSATLKDGGKAELDNLVKRVREGSGNDKRPLTVNSIIISGYSDSNEADDGDTKLSEARAKAVQEYLASKGLDAKLMFWEGKGSKYPVPVTKFCSS